VKDDTMHPAQRTPEQEQQGVVDASSRLNCRPFFRCVAVAVCFAVLAALTRDVFRYIETRVQILFFVGVAAAYEWLWKPQSGRSPSTGSLFANALVAIAALLMVRWQLEGLCPGTKQMRCIPNEQSVAFALVHRPLMPSVHMTDFTRKSGFHA
jgi:hypothetical protein